MHLSRGGFGLLQYPTENETVAERAAAMERGRRMHTGLIASHTQGEGYTVTPRRGPSTLHACGPLVNSGFKGTTATTLDWCTRRPLGTCSRRNGPEERR